AVGGFWTVWQSYRSERDREGITWKHCLQPKHSPTRPLTAVWRRRGKSIFCARCSASAVSNRPLSSNTRPAARWADFYTFTLARNPLLSVRFHFAEKPITLLPAIAVTATRWLRA